MCRLKSALRGLLRPESRLCHLCPSSPHDRPNGRHHGLGVGFLDAGDARRHVEGPWSNPGPMVPDSILLASKHLATRRRGHRPSARGASPSPRTQAHEDTDSVWSSVSGRIDGLAQASRNAPLCACRWRAYDYREYSPIRSGRLIPLGARALDRRSNPVRGADVLGNVQDLLIAQAIALQNDHATTAPASNVPSIRP